MENLMAIPIVLMAFFAILNPIGNLPVFIALTASDDEKN
ncbi:MarC family protein [Limosilactobacillus equigenerosi]|nr:MarC family protein [Limosilactobacillus equigenerosi]